MGQSRHLAPEKTASFSLFDPREVGADVLIRACYRSEFKLGALA